MRSFLEFAASRPTDRAPAPGDATALARGLEDWTRLAEESAEADTDLGRHMRAALDEPSARLWLEAIFGNSPFLTRTALLEPATVAATMRRGPDDSFAEILAGLNAQDGSQPRAAVMQFLRRSKRRASLVAAMADLAGHWPLDGVTKALSDLAETSLRLAMRHLLRQMHATGGITLPNPDDPERDCGVVVLGMGKLGAHELNYSSDIDLIILFEAEKIVTPDIDRLQQLMTRLARDIVQMMEERTADGYVFRTDLRLRPDPGSMPPAVAMEAAETYYASVGQNWERAALIKARPVAGDGAAAQAFLRELTPFIWRKHLDFAAIRDILSIKRQIDARHGGDGDIAGHNVKLGHGGIREIEFFVQTQQLIWGGRVPALRGNRTLDMLRVLAEQQRIAPEIAEDLARAYVFLREIEHRLQMIEDLQTHSLPETEEAMQRFAIFMGFAGRAEFEAALREVFTVVRGHFGQLVTRSKPLSAEGNLVFTGFENDPETLKTLERLGFRDARLVAETVRAWHHGRIRATRSEQARALLTELVPTLLRVLGQTASPDYAFARFDEFLSHLPAGVQMLSLLQAKPELLGLMAEIMGEAPGLATYLSRKPSLLYGVLTGDFFKPLGVNPDRVELGFDLDAALAHARDFEDVLDLTRRWVADRKFQIGVQLMQGHLTADHAARHYSALGDVAISTLLPPVAEQMATQHGVIADGRFVVLGLGKLGSQEMTAQSDLDLVFVYDAPPDAEASDGPKPLPPSAYYARFGQRLINALTAITSEGKLYEVDMALRPSGASGPIASSLEAFR
ncbi:MAG TPA: bifunctional [glutamine synthetase] adenylyltransferase/[glutamine synthetase]-adenylyl-L-tyrosine phosphorylase, partial [Stellaceae bacterium]|nr:bifunctional [glutamine synthetase] adenylyltransferase/[glutamine synthetase]-adenylyl-L-tyrosine phosphorylase [Stellaceae bacterium]